MLHNIYNKNINTFNTFNSPILLKKFLKMTAPYLPEDCIHYILKYLQYCRSTLFNCLLVNRFWCKATIPLLYADPFYFPIKKNNSSILSTLILCFNKTEILQLKNQLKLADINITDINDEGKPLFEYLKYLENFNYLNFEYFISKWTLNLPCAQLRFSKLRESIIPVFYQSILRQCDNIKRLDVSLYLLNSEIQTKLTKLITLHLECTNMANHEIPHEFLSNIANHCLNLRKLEISILSDPVSTIKEKLRSIIQKQNNLRVFKLNLHDPGFWNDIFLPLEVQKYLVCIEFKNIKFNNNSFKIFINLCNLKYLKFKCCKGLSSDQFEVLKYASFKLEGLYIIRSGEDYDTTSLMIKYLGGSLKELVLIEPQKVPTIIENISIYCPGLITLEINLDSRTDLSICTYDFKNLNIRTLIINDHYYHNVDTYYTCEILKNLANNLNINIKEVSLLCYYENSRFLNLRKFLENCHDHLEIINLNFSIELEPLEIILNYIERSSNNLQFLGVINPKEVLNDEESKLLNQIKAKGVKIVRFVHKYRYNEYDCYNPRRKHWM